ncbi:MAG: molybdopterin cofactor-binding domain-containing protein [Phenylobacterium sp.]|jgi:CO/xanthine dehydrogenase Mo-binding subunit|uniref:xanthine dehydrogenase family protein molybdopterin-binding subunit n=1 Tax=Phenylobacterium sp. TaxID=1871053 RepID=UPI002A35BB50|nr:molybdopterin cofactor-binding domain-containing protein [Phenylobacterium sp.]MDX9996599.1 molybdopterin-dependent oxidoreductase [Phenylobacterium sp.]
MIPATLQANPELDRWVRFDTVGLARVAFGKVEYGQGTLTALAQIAAEELDLPLSMIEVVNAATGAVPDEGMTVGSMSVESSGASVRAACAEVRALFVAKAAERLDCPPEEIDIRDGVLLVNGLPCGEDYWTLAPQVDLVRPATGQARWKSPDQHRIVGSSQPRLDLPAKLFGEAFLHDIRLPGMVHARVLRQPGPKARLAELDEAAVRAAAGGEVEILREGAFVAFIALREQVAARALAAAEAHAVWEDARDLSPALTEPASLKTLPHTDHPAGAEPAEGSNRRRHAATYGKPYIAHGSMGPSCGLAQFKDGKLTVWTHGQGVYPLRQMLVRISGLDPERIEVIHAQGPGCYGHNGADDAAVDAAVIALRRPGAPVRAQWRREDEFGWSPVGAAMHIELAAELDPSGRLVDYTAEIWSGPHVGRGRSLAELALPKDPDAPPPPPPPQPPPGAPRFSGGILNAIPSYDIPASRTLEHLVVPTPVRTSSLRGLGGPVNTFVGESFIDELAEIAGQDPLAYRLSMIVDPRGRAVVETVARMADWSRRWSPGAGRGLGLAYDRHRDRAGYCAAVAEVEVEAEVKLVKLWCCADAGLIVNPDGARNQIEGGMIMAASWVLKEQVRLGGAGIATTTWDDYPILRFSEVPPVEIELINTKDPRPFGIGELSQGPAMGAISNAVAHALGTRVRELPFTREKIAQALLA